MIYPTGRKLLYGDEFAAIYPNGDVVFIWTPIYKDLTDKEKYYGAQICAERIVGTEHYRPLTKEQARERLGFHYDGTELEQLLNQWFTPARSVVTLA